MRTGILGLPQSGKTTLFHVLTKAHAGAGGFSSSGGINVGSVEVPDARLAQLRDIFKPRKYTPARIEFVDLAGPPSGKDSASQLLPPPIVSSDLLLVVVRAFENPAVPHPDGVDPKRDLQRFTDDLLLRDLAVVETRIERLEKSKKVGGKWDEKEHAVLQRLLALGNEGRPFRDARLDAADDRLLRGFQLLTAKPLLVVFNVDEAQAQGAGLTAAFPEGPTQRAVEICGKVEMELLGLSENEGREFMEVLGITESGLSRVIRASYELLGLCSFFTVGEDEVRAWNVPVGSSALKSAGKIHSDLERGFIRAEVVGGEDLIAAGGLSQAKAKNLLRVEGKEYVVKDGDVLNIRFNV